MATNEQEAPEMMRLCATDQLLKARLLVLILDFSERKQPRLINTIMQYEWQYVISREPEINCDNFGIESIKRRKVLRHQVQERVEPHPCIGSE
jgi:hypothetical protein